MEPFAIIQAPTPLGLRPTGVEELGRVLVDHGLAKKLDATIAGTIDPGPYDNRREAATNFLNASAVMEYAQRLSGLVTEVLDRSKFPVVLGGDCSILLGNLLALNHRGEYGLLFVDGHTDFYQAEANVNGEIASSELAIATGREPPVLAKIGAEALIRDEHVVAFGFRDEAEQAKYGSQPLPSTITAFNLERIRRMGIERAVAAALTHLHSARDGFWVHVDADVLDDDIMPAVDYRIEGGLSWDELKAVLQAARASGRCVGVDVAIFNPRLDEDGRIAEALVATLVDGLRH